MSATVMPNNEALTQTTRKKQKEQAGFSLARRIPVRAAIRHLESFLEMFATEDRGEKQIFSNDSHNIKTGFLKGAGTFYGYSIAYNMLK